jgi:hypothetical protein
VLEAENLVTGSNEAIELAKALGSGLPRYDSATGDLEKQTQSCMYSPPEHFAAEQFGQSVSMPNRTAQDC